jgi:hypothetical protein
VEDTVTRERVEIDDEGVAGRVHESYPTENEEETDTPSLLDRTVRKVFR